MIPRIQLVTPATTLAVAVSDMKTFLGVSHSDHDTMIENMIRAAMRMAEDVTGITLTTTTFRMYLDVFRDVMIPRYPIQAISSVQYYDGSNTLTTLDTSLYDADIATIPCRIEFLNSPVVYDRLNAVQINFTAGHASVANINPGILQGIRMAVASMYDFRSDTVDRTVNAPSIDSNKLFMQFREPYFMYDYASGGI
jgi:uncharacterized phiE125 gp8 family phage protein